jgi:hypothetical protein
MAAKRNYASVFGGMLAATFTSGGYCSEKKKIAP